MTLEHSRVSGSGRVKGGSDGPSASRVIYVLTGEGAYEGLYALLHGVTPADAEAPWDLAYEGHIFEAEMLSFPDEPVPDMTGGRQLYALPTGPPAE